MESQFVNLSELFKSETAYEFFLDALKMTLESHFPTEPITDTILSELSHTCINPETGLCIMDHDIATY